MPPEAALAGENDKYVMSSGFDCGLCSRCEAISESVILRERSDRRTSSPRSTTLSYGHFFFFTRWI
jgi:hypothetical protein